MTTFVALLRGINVGGHHKLPMQDLRDLLGDIGCEGTKTYIQSGNAVFRSKDGRASLGKNITAAIKRDFGFAPSVQLYALADYKAILESNPFAEAVTEPKTLHISFLGEPAPAADLKTLDSLRANGEEFLLTDAAFFLHAPEGIGRSRLAAKVEKCLGVPGTSRNWRSAVKIAELAASIP